METTRKNYEIKIIDWLDGKLDKEASRDLFDFLDKNPSLKEELDSISSWYLKKPEISFPGKDDLIKSSSDITDNQFTILCLAHLEKDLNPEQEEELTEILTDEKRKKTFNAFQKIRLQASDDKYMNKNSLIRELPGNKLRRILRYSLSAAAVIATLFTITLFIPEKPQRNNIAVIEVALEDSLTIFSKSPVNVNSHKSQIVNSLTESSVERISVPAPEIKDNTINKYEVPSTITLPVKNIKIKYSSSIIPEEPVYDLISYEPAYFPSSDNTDRNRLGRFISHSYRKIVLKEKEATDLPIKPYELAEGGVNGLNRLLGWEMAIRKTRNEKGDIESVHFSSKLLSFNAPVKK